MSHSTHLNQVWELSRVHLPTSKIPSIPKHSENLASCLQRAPHQEPQVQRSAGTAQGDSKIFKYELFTQHQSSRPFIDPQKLKRGGQDEGTAQLKEQGSLWRQEQAISSFQETGVDAVARKRRSPWRGCDREKATFWGHRRDLFLPLFVLFLFF